VCLVVLASVVPGFRHIQRIDARGLAAGLVAPAAATADDARIADPLSEAVPLGASASSPAPLPVERRASMAPPVSPIPAAALSASAPARPSGCRPPYVIEPVGGKKLWKLDCL
jgi:hypothetical protein